MPQRSTDLLIALALLAIGAISIYRALRPVEVELRWETASEEGVAGFRVWRGQEDDPIDLPIHLVSEELVPARGTALEGASYRLVDPAAEAGQRYTYQIEEVDAEGLEIRHPEIIQIDVPDRRGLRLLEAFVSLSAGLWFLRGRWTALRSREGLPA